MTALSFTRTIFLILLLCCSIFIAQCSTETNNHIAERLVIKITVKVTINSSSKSLSFFENKNNEPSAESLRQLNQVLQSDTILVISPLVVNQTLTEELNKYVSLVLRSGVSDKQKQSLLESLKKIKLVSHAYFAPVGKDAGMETPGD